MKSALSFQGTYFNTSYVVIKRFDSVHRCNKKYISIHLMLLLNTAVEKLFHRYEYISIHLMLLLNIVGISSFLVNKHFNTSYVVIKQICLKAGI